MAYADQKFYAKSYIKHESVAGGTATAAGTASNSLADLNAIAVPFFNRTKLTGIKVRTVVIPNAASTDWVMSILNGTNTAATVTLTTATSGQWLTGTVTAANQIFAAGIEPVIDITGTATASGAAAGTYDVVLEIQEANA